MNRRLCGAAVLVLAVAGFVVSEGRAQVAVPAGRSTLAIWQAERAFYLNMIQERAKAQLNNTLLKIQIGTMAPIDADASRQAVAQIDALIKADSVRTSAPANSGPGVSAVRIKLAELLNALDLAEVKFDNGIGTTKSMFDAYLAVVNLLLS
jgi:hypothetical protein